MEAVPAELIEETLRSTDDVSNPIGGLTTKGEEGLLLALLFLR